MKQVKNFFSQEDQEKITLAIRDVESRTSGEVAVMVVEQSDSYPEGRILAGVLLGGLGALIVTDLLCNDSLWYFVPITVSLAVLVGWACTYLPVIKIMFIPRHSLEERVQGRAVRAFYEKELYRTKNGTGVLFFISLLERKVWVLADHGIHNRIRHEDLQLSAQRVATGVKERQLVQALCQEIHKIGAILASHFPRRPDDINELSDDILTE